AVNLLMVAHRQVRLRTVVTVFGLMLTVSWAYWPTLVELARRWSTEPLYSHGYLIPGIGIVLLWLRRQELETILLRPNLWGIPILILGTVMRMTGAYFYLFATDRFSILPILAGICLTLGGWQVLRWTSPALVLLIFMLPLPGRLPEISGIQLQRIATTASTN